MSEFMNNIPSMTRNISAPFYQEDKQDESAENINVTDAHSEIEIVPLEEIVSLEEICKKIDRNKYYGPISESNWVFKGNDKIPGKLIAGSFPGHPNDAVNTRNIIQVLNRGVTVIVNLQQEYKKINSSWRFGVGVRPYMDDLEKIIANKSQHPTLTSTITEVVFIHEPIRDCGIIDDAKTLKLAKELFNLLKDGEVVYLHCWGGHGRTGVLVCLILHLIYGLNAIDAIILCEFLHDIRRLQIDVGSPQTLEQRQQVTRIIGNLMIKK